MNEPEPVNESVVKLSPKCHSNKTPVRVVHHTMGKERRILLFLLFLAPATAELLSGSAPPIRFFHPIGFLILTAVYGGGVLLIREARARWGLQWPLIFLAVAYGVYEEGTMIHSFFNHNHEDLHQLSRYGAFLGVQWPWALMVTFFHATVSTVVPITIVDLLWPEYRFKPLLKRRGVILCLIGISLATLFFALALWSQQQGHADPYHPNPLLLLGSVAVVVALVLAASKLRGQQIATSLFPLAPPFIVGLLCFFAQLFNLLMPHAFAGTHSPGFSSVVVQIGGIALALLFVVFQICHRQFGRRHAVAAVFGTLLPFVIGSFQQEFGRTNNPDPTHGMAVIGVVAFGLLMWWRHRVLLSNSSQG